MSIYTLLRALGYLVPSEDVRFNVNTIFVALLWKRSARYDYLYDFI